MQIVHVKLSSFHGSFACDVNELWRPKRFSFHFPIPIPIPENHFRPALATKQAIL